MNLRKRLFILFCLVSQLSQAQDGWQKIQTVDEVCVAFPEQISSIFTNLNLDYPGLEEIKKAYEGHDIPFACKKLLDYYGKSKSVIYDLPDASQKTTTAADSVLNDIYTFQLVSDKVPRMADGHLKWSYTGPEDDIEWAWALNRHYPARELIEAYFETGNPKYARYIDIFIKDWIISSWPYPAVKSTSAMWRGLEVSFRVKIWSGVFFRLWKTKLISPATQLLILSSLPQHAHYAQNFHGQGNWLTMEISGLATVSTSWPELKESKAWMDYSVKTMVASMKDQVYPDGVQTELTSSYHSVALSNFNLFADICRKNNVPLPEYYSKTIEDMWDYLALTMRPDGFGLLNNDADLDNNRSNILGAASDLYRPDWTYIASNEKTGTQPKSGPSFIFTYAGQLISRSDFGSDAHWSFLDIGPWGSGHQHNDKMHLSVFAYGRDFLVDGGRFAYKGEVAKKFRKYATGSPSHNLILVDGKEQANGPKVTETHLFENLYCINKDFDYGSGIFDKFSGLEGQFCHTRSVIYVRGKFWVVADQLKTDRPRNIETLWHWHPGNRVEIEESGKVATQNKRGNLQIIPVGNTDWKVALVKGRESPDIQGWYSKGYNTFEPGPATIFSSRINANSTSVWVLWPSEGASPVIKTQILDQHTNSVKVRVACPGNGYWDILIPFANSADAKMEFISKSVK
jgi:hypothetical protein